MLHMKCTSVPEKLVTLSDADVKFNRWPYGARHIFTHTSLRCSTSVLEAEPSLRHTQLPMP